MLKFSANVSTMFTEVPFLSRFEQAKNAGFDTVEINFPYDFDAKEISRVKCGLKCFLINSFCAKPFGTASQIGEEVQFLRDLHKVTPYYNELNIKRVHLMAGMREERFSFEEQLVTYKANINSAVEFLENLNIVGLIEPSVKEGYFLNDFETAIDVIKYVNSDNIKLLLDVYHLHMLTGNAVDNLEKYYPYAGHIQVSQHPGRREPFFPNGEIDYEKVFTFLQEKKYSEPIGLEYFPSVPTAESLEWMKNYKK